MTYQDYKERIKNDDSWNTPARVEYIYGLMKSLDLEGKKVLDLGCRFGLYSYIALELGASYVVGADIEYALIEQAETIFQSLDVDPERYCLTPTNALYINYAPYDVILALGFLYNVPNQEFFLNCCRGANASVLLELWLDNNGEDYPVIRWLQDTKQEENGSMANRQVTYRQYLPNIKYAEKMFTRCGFRFKQLCSHTEGHCNVFFLLESGEPVDFSPRTWGTNGMVNLYNM